MGIMLEWWFVGLAPSVLCKLIHSSVALQRKRLCFTKCEQMCLTDFVLNLSDFQLCLLFNDLLPLIPAQIQFISFINTNDFATLEGDQG